MMMPKCGKPIISRFAAHWRCSECGNNGCSNGTVYVPLLAPKAGA